MILGGDTPEEMHEYAAIWLYHQERTPTPLWVSAPKALDLASDGDE